MCPILNMVQISEIFINENYLRKLLFKKSIFKYFINNLITFLKYQKEKLRNPTSSLAFFIYSILFIQYLSLLTFVTVPSLFYPPSVF